jgi:hypothetical protein
MSANWSEVEDEWAGYDIEDLETGEASGLPQEHSGTTETTDKGKGGLMAWLRGLVGKVNVEGETRSRH